MNLIKLILQLKHKRRMKHLKTVIENRAELLKCITVITDPKPSNQKLKTKEIN